MAKECEENLQKIVAGFQDCRNAFTAIGDETRQLIVGNPGWGDCGKNPFNEAFRFPSSADPERSRNRRNAESGNEKLLLSERR